jgi:DNA adenine methylase
MFFALRPDRATISDVNIDLMNTYRALKRDPELLIQTLLSYEHSRAFYDMVRQKAPPSANGQAARLIYLNKTAFNGLYRVNRSGEFNVPFGRYRNPGICQPDRIREASHALRRARILHGDFAEAVAPARSDDLVYMDPPYITGHTNNGFVKYNAPLFSWHDQIRLSTTARSLFDRGVHVIVSNADHGSIRALYFDFFVYRMRRRILVGVQGSRRLATELLISSRRIGALEDRLVKT